MNSPPSSSLFKRHPEIAVGLLTFFVRFECLYRFQASPFFEPIAGGNDRALYDGLAQQIAGGAILPSGVFEYMPLYPWILGLVYTIFKGIGLGPNLFAVGFLGAVLDAATSCLIVRLARHIGASLVAALLMGILYAFYPIAIIYSMLTMPNTLNAFLLILFACGYGQWRASTSSGWRSSFGLGLLAGLLSLGYAGMLLIILGIFLYEVLVQIRKQPFRIARPACLLVGTILPILPVTVHNWRAEHRFVLVTAHGGFNFYMGNHAQATGYPVQIGNFRGEAGSLLVDARAEAERVEQRKLTAAEFSQFWSQRAWRFIEEHPFRAAQLFGIKFLKFWNRLEYDDLRLLPAFRLTGLGFTSLLWPGFAVISGLGFIGLILARHCRWLKVVAISGMAGVFLFFITSRYRLTFAPILCSLGAAGLGEIARRWRERSRDIPGGIRLVFITLLAMGLAFWPLPQSDFRGLDYYNTAANLLARGQPQAALNTAIEGISIAPEPHLYFVAGNALLELKRASEAVSAYEMAIHLKPNDASAHYNLAQAWMLLHQPSNAAHEAKLALQHDPQHPRARLLLDEAMKLGRKK